MPRQSNPVNFRSVEAERRIDERSLPDVRGLGRSGIAARDLERYYGMLDRLMEAVSLSVPAAALLVSAAGVAQRSGATAPTHLVVVHNHIHNAEVARWFGGLDYWTALAVVDAAEVAGILLERDGVPIEEAVRRARLVKDG